MEDLLRNIHELEIKHKNSLDPEDAKQLETLRIKLSTYLDRRDKDKYRFFAHRFYEHGNKCGKLLARQLKKQEEMSHVHNIRIGNKQIIDTKSIAMEFEQFYKGLYNIQPNSSGLEEGIQVEEIRNYIKESALSPLTLEVVERLEEQITVEEIKNAIKNLPMGKSLGPDDLTNAYYKKCINILTIPICNYFNQLTATNPLPPRSFAGFCDSNTKTWERPTILRKL